tara:strand:+ start:1461 stop:3041 length:1581 start_codon:yes stop_codon:yes gene_type:complete
MKDKNQSISCEQVIKARKVSTPFVALETPDPGATSKALFSAIDSYDGGSKPSTTSPQFLWDAVNGIRSYNELAQTALPSMLDPVGGDALATAHPTQALIVLASAPAGSFIVMANMHLYWEASRLDPSVVQAIWNLRDIYKRNRRMLVMTMPSCVLPAELRHDVVVFSEPLPKCEDFIPVIENLHNDAKLDQPSDELMDKAIHALSGLAIQQGEQVVAMSLRTEGLDIDSLREHQHETIKQTPGVKVWEGDTRFDSLRGLDALTDFIRSCINGKRPPRAFVFIDEIEKMMSGAFGGDSSGTSQEQHGYMLQFMEDERADGVLLVGSAGTGKTAIAQASGNEGDCPTLAMDFGAMKGSLVGETGQMTRQAFEVIKAIGQGSIFFIATCNNIDSLPPELRRRFKQGTWYVDMPDAAARKSLWKLYGKKFNVKTTGVDFDEGWTGSDIKNCCETADRLSMSLKEASRFICPVAKSSPEVIRKLRRLSHNRFLDASKGGTYQDATAPSTDDSTAVIISDTSPDRIFDMNES